MLSIDEVFALRNVTFDEIGLFEDLIATKKDLGISWEKIYTFLRMSRSSFWRLRHGERRMDVETYFRLCLIIGAPIDRYAYAI